MPRLDGTGPQGRGQRTGRGLGNCQGSGRFSFADKTLTKEERKKSFLDEKERIEKELSNPEKGQ